MSAIPTSVRAAVRYRDFDRCVRCASHGTDIHHRMRRREGGHTLGNCVLLCRTCHEWAHSNPDAARTTGFIVSIWGDVGSTPLQSWRGVITHDDAGGIQFVPTKEEV